MKLPDKLLGLVRLAAFNLSADEGKILGDSSNTRFPPHLLCGKFSELLVLQLLKVITLESED